MARIRLDHFITALQADSIDDHVAAYKEAGFNVAPGTVPHEPGLRDGFVRFGPEYLEFLWVEHEDLFEAGADSNPFPQLRRLRAAHRPFGIGIDTDDAEGLRQEWIRRGYSVQEQIEGRPRGADPTSPPIWIFLPIPAGTLEGAFTFALVYLTGDKTAPRKVTVAPNTTYAIAGVTFVSDRPESRARQWRDLLAPSVEVGRVGAGYCVEVGAHKLAWMTPAEYGERYGLSFEESPHMFGEMGMIHLLATDLDKVAEMVSASGRTVRRFVDSVSGADTLVIEPDPGDNFTLSVAERPAEEWLEWRRGVTGENLVPA